MFLCGAISLFLCFAHPLFASERQPGQSNNFDFSDSGLLQNRLEGLNRFVSLTGLNGDYLPGMVTVLYGNDLKQRGVMTVGEALNRVPGMTMAVDSDGNWSTLVRGLPKTLSTGHFKFLLNGEPMPNLLGIDLLPNIPMEQIEKIEVIRGPASVRYGESAYAGVVNVVTKNVENTFFSGAGDYDTYLAGANLSKQMPEKDMAVALSLAWQTTHRGDLYLGMDNEGSTPGTVIDLGENTSEDISGGVTSLIHDRSINEKSLLSLVMHVDKNGFSLDGHHMENGQGDFYSTVQQGLSLKKEMTLSRDVTSTLSVQWLGQSSDEDYGPYRDSGDDGVYRVSYDAESWRGGMAVSMDMNEDHTIELDASVKKNNPIHLERENGSGKTRYSDQGRWLYSLMIQDTFHATDQLALTFGGRGDYYDDLEQQFSPRLAAVYRLNSKRNGRMNHLIKLQAARAVRPQSFLEANDVSADDFDLTEPRVETVDTLELGYILRTPASLARLTSFASHITSGDNSEYRASGIEIELEQEILSDLLSFESQGSWAHIRDTDTHEAPDGSVEYLAHAGVVWQVFPRMDLSIQYTFTGGQISEGKRADPSHSTDITVSLTRILGGLSIRGGVKNLFEDDVTYPSHLDQDRLIEDGYLYYPGSYQEPERWWWMRVEYEF